MSKHMIITSSNNKEKVDQLIEEDLLTYCDNIIEMVEDQNSHEMIINMTNLLLTDLKSVDLGDIAQFLTKIMNFVNSKEYDKAKTELLLCKNYVGDVQVLYT